MTRHTVVCAIVLVGLGSIRPGAQGSLPPVVDRATEYVHSWIEAFSKVVAEERYVQETTNPPRRRVLRSDFHLVRFPRADYWYAFRNVFEVDGRSVRELVVFHFSAGVIQACP